jgi:glycosyltransferase involved in cell wall biosynthesis
VPDGLSVRVTVVDNNCTDGTRALVESRAATAEGRIRYVSERRPGRSAALNAGIAATDGDLIGFVDDDEEIDRTWYEVIHERFTRGGVDYISGPYWPKWGAPRPRWLPDRYGAVIGWVRGDSVGVFGDDFEAMPMGGNIVLKRSLVEHVGPYRTDIMRAQDADYFERLKLAGARGEFLPTLIIHHYVPPERLRKAYFRQWCLWRGLSVGVTDRGHPQRVAYLAGVPRYLIGEAARAFLRLATWRNADRPDWRFADELALWDLASFAIGRWFPRLATRYCKIAQFG